MSSEQSEQQAHFTGHTIMWSPASQRIIVGCNEVKGSAHMSFMRFYTVSHRAQQILHQCDARGNADVGRLAAPVIEVRLVHLRPLINGLARLMCVAPGSVSMLSLASHMYC